MPSRWRSRGAGRSCGASTQGHGGSSSASVLAARSPCSHRGRQEVLWGLRRQRPWCRRPRSSRALSARQEHVFGPRGQPCAPTVCGLTVSANRLGGWWRVESRSAVSAAWTCVRGTGCCITWATAQRCVTHRPWRHWGLPSSSRRRRRQQLSTWRYRSIGRARAQSRCLLVLCNNYI